MSVADLAQLQGIHIDTARNRLRELDRKTGGRTIIWVGTRMFTTLSLIKQADPRWLEDRDIEEGQIDNLQSQIKELDGENLELRRRIRALESVMRANGHTTSTDLHGLAQTQVRPSK